MAFCVVLITAPAGEKAAGLARLLVEQKLAACVNRVPGVESVYWWHGKIETAAEELLIAKTDKLKVKALVKAVKAAHPYETPEVVALRIKEGNRDYLRWIADSLGTPRKKQRIPTGLPKKPRGPKKSPGSTP
ncbi:MAG TPA: divalent-cation tolerance protein CutA [bacterium]|nr:divalent-cation tolerance protein CutA [bacterium]